ncbi:hypothetical protein BGX33_003327, partial [Mortierella sp. NVP41]
SLNYTLRTISNATTPNATTPNATTPDATTPNLNARLTPANTNSTSSSGSYHTAFTSPITPYDPVLDPAQHAPTVLNARQAPTAKTVRSNPPTVAAAEAGDKTAKMGPVAEMEPLNEEPPDKLVPYQ